MGYHYQKRRLKANKIRRQIASNRAMLLRFRVFLSFLGVCLLLYFCYKVLFVSQWYLNIEKLRKADPAVLKINGNVITPKHKIVNIIRQTEIPHTQIFRLNTKELENNIAQLQPIKKVYIRRYWFPARLTISVEERIPAFFLMPNLNTEPNSVLTVDGVLIDHEYFPFNSTVKPIKLLTYGVRDGLEEVWDKKKVEDILKLVKAIETYSRQEIQYIDLRNQNNVYIMLQEHLILFGEINETALQRAKSIASILPQAKKEKRKIKYIDLRWNDSQYFKLEGAKESKEKSKEELKKEEENNQQEQKTEEKPKKEKFKKEKMVTIEEETVVTEEISAEDKTEN